MTKWRIAALVAVGISFFTFIVIKEIAGRHPIETEPAMLQAQLDQLYASDKPSVLVFHAEPTEFCCEGTRLAYQEMRSSAETLLALVENDNPCVFIEVNALISDDRDVLFSALERHSVEVLNSALVIGADGSKLREFSAPYDPSEIAAYVRDLP